MDDKDQSVISATDVYWQKTWGPKYPDKPPTEMMFEPEMALARLLADEVIFLNSFHWEDEWPESARKMAALLVNCNDVFAWGCADSEILEYDEIQGLYDLWLADRRYGPVKWAAIKRRQKPQPPLVKDMKSAGAWDDVMEHLGENTQDAEAHAIFESLRAKLKAGSA